MYYLYNHSTIPLGKTVKLSYHKKHMRKDTKRLRRRVLQVLVSVFVAVVIIGAFVFVTQGRDIPVLQPQGVIAEQQLQLILITTGLGVFVVIPVFILLFAVAWKYREGNTKAKYEPEFDGSVKLEALWWGIPCLIILVLAIITAISTHALDPYKPLESDKKPVEVQVVSLQWKWLFIYPESGVATVNYLNIPEDTPINFSITSDAPMNSFWIPALGGQVYSMTGMTTKLHLKANEVGTYMGNSANLSGDGFSGMYFKANSLTSEDFEKWVKESKNSPDFLTGLSYDELRKASKNNPEKTYGLVEDGLFTSVIMRYMSSEGNKNDEHSEGASH